MVNREIKKSIQGHRRYNGGQSEMIRTIEIDIRVENICLKDRFEWDINDPNNVPEVINLKFVLLINNRILH